jgi:NADH-quinone oxidoreductase subunit N
MNNSIFVVLPLAIVLATAIVVLFVDAFAARRPAALAWVAATGLVVAAAVAAGQWTTWKGGWALWRLFTGGLVMNARHGQYGFSGMVRLDQYGLFFTILFCAIGVLTIMLSDDYLAQHRIKPGEFYALLLLILAGTIGMAISTDLIALLVSFELMSLPSYVLAGVLRADRRSGEAAIKYFINGAFSSAVLAFGLALVYGVTGQTAYGAIRLSLAHTDPRNAMLLVALVLVSTGFGFKVAAVPFHGWAPDVYEGAPTPVTAFMSVGIKAGAFAGFLRLVGPALLPAAQGWSDVLIVLAVLTMIVGNVMALPQRNLKRLLAYSSIAHAGYLLLGLIAVGRSHDPAGASAILFYLAAYTFMNLGAFGVLVLIRNRRPFAYTLDELAGLGRTMPLTALAMLVFMLSLTGIPPLAGFWGKFFIFSAVVAAHLTWLAVVAVIMSSVSAFYYLRVVWYLYFREAEAPAETAGEQPELLGSRAGITATTAVAVLGVLAVGVYPAPIIAAAQGAVRLLLGA